MLLDFEAQEDAFTLVKAKEIQKSAGRVNAARSFAESQAEKFEQMAKDLPKVERKPMNNSVRNSKMEPK